MKQFNKCIGKITMMAVIALAGLSAQTSEAAATKSGPGGNTFFMGLASDGIYSVSSAVPALTALLNLGDRTALQLYFGMSTIDPVNLGGGANFKYSVVGNNSKGFHVGGGVGLGVTGAALTQTFYINIAPGLGGHYEVVDGVILAVDASFAVKITTSPSNADMAIGGNSGLLGASIVFGL